MKHAFLSSVDRFFRASGAVLASTLAGLFSGQALAAPQTFNTALPVAEGEAVFREQFLYRKADDDPGPANRDLEVSGGISVLAYGVTSDLTLFGMLPYLDKSLDLTTPADARITRGTSGFGDARIFARYTMYQKDGRGRSFRIAPFAGIELPTGDDDGRDSFGRLPQPLQSGSGSWDPFLGVVSTFQTLDFQFDAQIAYKANTKANGFEFGDELRLDASAQYRVWPRELRGGVPGFLYTGLEVNFLHRDNNRVAGTDDPHSGGESLFLAPTLQYVTKRWVLEGAVQVPVWQDLNGQALEDDMTVRAGFRLNF